jgi:hypothetical protein
MKNTISVLAIAFLALTCFAPIASAGKPLPPLKGQLLYLPLVSHVFQGPKNRPFELTKTFVFRNRDRRNSIKLISIEYFNSEGQNLGSLLDNPQVLAPLASFQKPVASPAKKGGKKKGAPSLIVRWKADKPAAPPLVKCIMIGATGQQGISFSTIATPIR